ncbi:hypothetical protein SAMN05216241_10645 [Limimonas halophila]|uniref:DNA repair protein MmcB-related protein n=1 Tax=Limimonas halophila TaxID=1082479 RepID=A0A1G7RY36_9PROT|nr:MmcB family DNA repair protein [Limimonas halophila]SDG15688.1 hypothetical protein SAMN05216241_10645 [Limimonas halophila]
MAGGDAPDGAAPGVWLARGVCRGLAARGYAVVTEMPLADGRRADVLGVDERGGVLIVEVKASRADFRADAKWDAYRAFCDRFAFAVPPEFPMDILPDEATCGVLVADGYDAQVLREPPEHKLAGARRRAVLLRFARTAARRLHRAIDPEAGVDDG